MSLNALHCTPRFLPCNFVFELTGLMHRQFRAHLKDLDAAFQDILYFNDTRWLSRGKSLTRFYKLLPEIISFMEGKTPLPELKDKAWLADLYYLVDITGHLNELNVQMQGRDQNLIQFSDMIKAFRVKLDLWTGQMSKGELHHFPTLKKENCSKSDCARFVPSLKNLRREFDEKFQELSKLSQEILLMSDPFSVNPSDCPPEIQLDLIDLQNNSILKNRFASSESLMDFWHKAGVYK